MIEQILDKINSLGAFELNLLASSVFLVATIILRLFLKKVASSGRVYLKQYEQLYFYRYIAHKNIYESEEVAEPIKFFFLTCLMSLKWLILGLMILAFFQGVVSVTNGDWFHVVGYWLGFNYMLEGYMWARDSRNDKTAIIIYEEKMKEMGEGENKKQS